MVEVISQNDYLPKYHFKRIVMRNTACMYLRLSREDGDSNESNSISNQRQIIKSYAK